MSDESECLPPVSPRILVALGLGPSATEVDAIDAIERLQREVAATRPRLAHELPRRIRYWRKRAGFKSFELARKMGLNVSTVSTWESGRSAPSHETLERVSFFCGIDLVTFWSPLPNGDDDNGHEEPTGQAASG